MKIISFGSLNIDRVYDVPHIVAPGETIHAAGMNTFAGGKGLNQSLAAARAGGQVVHMGAIGQDGMFLKQLLDQSGVNTNDLCCLDTSSGHAIIQVTPDGHNSIVVFGGANQQLSRDYIIGGLDKGQPGDFVLLQNETNEVATIIRQAHQRGLRVVFNPSPVPENPDELPLECVSMLIVNEIEGALLAHVPGDTAPDEMLDALKARYPKADIVLTLGSRGAVCDVDGERAMQPIFSVHAVDTTAAGDTFCGYFLAGRCHGLSVKECLLRASAASAIAVSRAGAAPSIPQEAEVDAFLA